MHFQTTKMDYVLTDENSNSGHRWLFFFKIWLLILFCQFDKNTFHNHKSHSHATYSVVCHNYDIASCSVSLIYKLCLSTLIQLILFPELRILFTVFDASTDDFRKATKYKDKGC
jgi:hypothetical protein